MNRMQVIVAGNRYVAVCKPLDAPRLCTKTRVQFEIAAIVSGFDYVIPLSRTYVTRMPFFSTMRYPITPGCYVITMYYIMYAAVPSTRRSTLIRCVILINSRYIIFLLYIFQSTSSITYASIVKTQYRDY